MIPPLRLPGILLAGLLLSACGGSDDLAAVEQLRPVRVFTVTDNGEIRQRTFSGISQSAQESRLSFKVGGNIVELPIQVGDQISPGELIARLDASSFELEAEQARANLIQAQANQRNARANYDRAKNLYENANASRNDLDTARAGAESAEAEVKAAQKALEIAELNRSYTRLNANAACAVASVAVELNENVKSGEEIAKVNCGADIEVAVGVPEGLIAQMNRQIPTMVRFNAIPGTPFAAAVTEIGVAGSSSAATFPVVVQLTEADPRMRPNMAAQVTFEFINREGAAIHVVPASAVVNDQNGRFVYLAEPAGDGTATVTRHDVELGELTENGIEIFAGLEDGDLVVTAGVSAIRDQQTVLLP